MAKANFLISIEDITDSWVGDQEFQMAPMWCPSS